MTAKTMAKRTALIFTELSVANLGISSSALMDNGSYFLFKFFTALCMELYLKSIKTCRDFYCFEHPQDKGQVEHFNVTIISRLKHYEA